MRIAPMTDAFAADIATWRYAAPYERYSLDGVDPAFLVDPANGYVTLVDAPGALIGYRCFGPDGRVPGFAYDESACDTGGGLRPALTGRGLGALAIATGLAHGRELLRPAAFRVTVETSNARALRVVASLGFTCVAEFTATSDGRPYRVLVRAEQDRPSDRPRDLPRGAG